MRFPANNLEQILSSYWTKVLEFLSPVPTSFRNLSPNSLAILCTPKSKRSLRPGLPCIAWMLCSSQLKDSVSMPRLWFYFSGLNPQRGRRWQTNLCSLMPGMLCGNGDHESGLSVSVDNLPLMHWRTYNTQHKFYRIRLPECSSVSQWLWDAIFLSQLPG